MARRTDPGPTDIEEAMVTRAPADRGGLIVVAVTALVAVASVIGMALTAAQIIITALTGEGML